MHIHIHVNKGYEFKISKPVFWTVVLMLYLVMSLQFVADAKSSLGAIGALFWMVIFSPVFFGCGAACGFVIGAAHAVLTRNRKSDVHPRLECKPNVGVSRAVVAMMIGSLFATTVVLIAPEHLFSINTSNFTLAIWIMCCALGYLMMSGLLRLLSRTRIR